MLFFLMKIYYLDPSAKGNFYIRKTIYTYKYVNPLLGKNVKLNIQALFYVVIEDEFNGRTEKQYTIRQIILTVIKIS